jgi:BirA family transcriptional regulator, biotin operon repressor / biotin---[acetyl-CoA-carboxylase] ligase
MTSLDCERIRAAFPGRRIEFYLSLESTMTAAAALDCGSAVLAEEQTAGQGRHGHDWHSVPGAGIYCSVVLEPKPLLTLALGLATVSAIRAATTIATDLRWPNDVMIGPRKVAGILVQTSGAKAVAGIGINVNQESFPAPLDGEAISLRIEAGRVFKREDLVLALLRSIDRYMEKDPEDILEMFTKASSYVSGKRVSVDQPEGQVVGTTIGLDSEGFLLVRKDDGTDLRVLAGGVRALSA